MYQHDPRHVDVLVKDLGLEHGNSVQTAAAPDAADEEEPEPMRQDQHDKYRSQVARCLFLSHDRADVPFIAISSSSPCLMRTLSDSLFDLSIYFTFLLFFIFIFQHFLLPFIFPEVK